MTEQITSTIEISDSSKNRSFSGTPATPTPDTTVVSGTKRNVVNVYDIRTIDAAHPNANYFLDHTNIGLKELHDLPLKFTDCLNSIGLALDTTNKKPFQCVMTNRATKTYEGHENVGAIVPPVSEFMHQYYEVDNESYLNFIPGNNLKTYTYDRGAIDPTHKPAENVTLIQEETSILYRPLTTTIKSTNVLGLLDAPDQVPAARYLRANGTIYQPLTYAEVVNGIPSQLDDPSVAAWMRCFAYSEFASVRNRISAASSETGNVYTRGTDSYRRWQPAEAEEDIVELYTASLGTFMDYFVNQHEYNTNNKKIVAIPYNAQCATNNLETWAYIAAMTKCWEYLYRYSDDWESAQGNGAFIERMSVEVTKSPYLNMLVPHTDVNTVSYVLVNVGNPAIGEAHDAFFDTNLNTLSSCKNAAAPVLGTDIVGRILALLTAGVESGEHPCPYNIFASMYPDKTSLNLGAFAAAQVCFRGFSRGCHINGTTYDSVYLPNNHPFRDQYRPILDARNLVGTLYHRHSFINSQLQSNNCAIRVPHFNGQTAVSIVSGILSASYANDVARSSSVSNFSLASCLEVCTIRAMWMWDTYMNNMGLPSASMNRFTDQYIAGIPSRSPKFSTDIVPSVTWFTTRPTTAVNIISAHFELTGPNLVGGNANLLPFITKFTRYYPYELSSVRPKIVGSFLTNEVHKKSIRITVDDQNPNVYHPTAMDTGKYDSGMMTQAWFRSSPFIVNANGTITARTRVVICRSFSDLIGRANWCNYANGFRDQYSDINNSGSHTQSYSFEFFTGIQSRRDLINNGLFKFTYSLCGVTADGLIARGCTIAKDDFEHPGMAYGDEGENGMADIAAELNF